MQDGLSGKPRHQWAKEEARERNLAMIDENYDHDAHRAWCAGRKQERKARHEQAYHAAESRRRTGRAKHSGHHNKGGGKKRGCKGSKRVRRG